MNKILKTIISISCFFALSFLLIVNFTTLPARADDCTAVFTDLDNWGKSSSDAQENVLGVRIVGLVGNGSYASYFEGVDGELIVLRYSANVGSGLGAGFEAVNFNGYFSDDRYGLPTQSSTPTLTIGNYPFGVTPNTINKHDDGVRQAISIATKDGNPRGIVTILNDTINPVQCSGNLIYGIVPGLSIKQVGINTPNKAYAIYYEKQLFVNSTPPK